jgi:hypothetical protein
VRPYKKIADACAIPDLANHLIDSRVDDIGPAHSRFLGDRDDPPSAPDVSRPQIAFLASLPFPESERVLAEPLSVT